MGHDRYYDYPTITKRGFQVGVSLLLLGVFGEAVLPVVVGPLPGWETALFFDVEVLGLLIGFFVPLLFGLVLPLTE